MPFKVTVGPASVFLEVRTSALLPRSRCCAIGFGLAVSISLLSWQLLTAVESVDLTNHSSEGHEKVSHADLALYPVSVKSLMFTRKISLK